MARAGEFKHTIKLRRSTITQDWSGQEIKSYSTYAQPKAAIKSISTTQKTIGDQIEIEGLYEFRIRTKEQILEKDRIEFNDEIYEILEVINFNSRMTFQIIKAQKNKS